MGNALPEGFACMTEGLAERIVAEVAVSEGFNFAMKHQIPPMFPQSKFVLVLNRNGKVRVMWLAFATHEAKPNMTSTPFILKLLTADLNDASVAASATKSGVSVEYAVV